MSGKSKVLVVDDQKTFREAVAFEFEMLGYDQIMAKNGEEAYEKYKTNEIDLIICDIRMPIWDGRRFLKELRKVSKVKPPFIFMTGFADLLPCQAFHEGADAFIGKPINPEALLKTVEKVMTPLVERLQTKPDTEPSLSINVEVSSDEYFRLGRLGFYLSSKIDSQIGDLKVGDVIAFDVACRFDAGRSLQGIGEVLWVRPEGVDDALPGVGVRVEYLSDGCRDNFVQLAGNQDSVISIPDGNRGEEVETA